MINKHLENDKNGLSEKWFNVKVDNPEFDIPEYFSSFDINRPADEWVAEALDTTMNTLFEERLRTEHYLTS